MRILFLILALCPAMAAAQDWPAKPVRMIVPYAAGGLPDTMTRILGVRLAEAIGQQVLVENRGGAGGIAGTEAVAKSAPDGYTLLVADVGQVAINPHLYAKLPYDPLKDLAAVTLLGTTSLFLVANPAVPATSFAELVALARAQPGKLNYGSSGTGSIHHLATEALKAALKLDIVHVPYKGMGQAVPALLGGQVSILYSALPAIDVSRQGRQAQAARDQHAQALAAGARRADASPSSACPATISRPRSACSRPRACRPRCWPGSRRRSRKAVRHPDVSQRFLQLGIEPVGSTPEAYAARIRAAYERYARS